MNAVCFYLFIYCENPSTKVCQAYIDREGTKYNKKENISLHAAGNKFF